MRGELENLLEPLTLDDGILFTGIYRIDGIPIFVHYKHRRVISIIDWLENQIKVLINYIASGYFQEAEFKLQDSVLMLYPISKTLVLCILTSEEASLYKLKLDIDSIVEGLKKYV